MHRRVPAKCPECACTSVAMKRSWPRVFLGVLLVLVMGALAIPTLGISLIFMIWGVFLIQEKPTCPECGWEPVDRR